LSKKSWELTLWLGCRPATRFGSELVVKVRIKMAPGLRRGKSKKMEKNDNTTALKVHTLAGEKKSSVAWGRLLIIAELLSGQRGRYDASRPRKRLIASAWGASLSKCMLRAWRWCSLAVVGGDTHRWGSPQVAGFPCKQSAYQTAEGTRHVMDRDVHCSAVSVTLQPRRQRLTPPSTTDAEKFAFQGRNLERLQPVSLPHKVLFAAIRCPRPASISRLCQSQRAAAVHVLTNCPKAHVRRLIDQSGFCTRPTTTAEHQTRPHAACTA
jgi:hypothetical protein